MQERCLQMKIGSCLGCEVQQIAVEHIRRKKEISLPEIINRVSGDLCPTGVKMQEPALSKPAIW